jgi:hypothetical protein
MARGGAGAAPGETVAGAIAPRAARLARGVGRALGDAGYTAITEFSLKTGRRVDVIALNAAGHFVIVEIKTSEADFRTDAKWPEYLEFCDTFYFAVPEDFPRSILPADRGLMVADDYGAAILRAAPEAAMHASRRRAQILRFALAAGGRLRRASDPGTG